MNCLSSRIRVLISSIIQFILHGRSRMGSFTFTISSVLSSHCVDTHLSFRGGTLMLLMNLPPSWTHCITEAAGMGSRVLLHRISGRQAKHRHQPWQNVVLTYLYICAPMWVGCTKTALKKLKVAYNNCFRRFMRLPWRNSASEIYTFVPLMNCLEF